MSMIEPLACMAFKHRRRCLKAYWLPQGAEVSLFQFAEVPMNWSDNLIPFFSLILGLYNFDGKMLPLDLMVQLPVQTGIGIVQVLKTIQGSNTLCVTMMQIKYFNFILNKRFQPANNNLLVNFFCQNNLTKRQTWRQIYSQFSIQSLIFPRLSSKIKTGQDFQSKLHPFVCTTTTTTK